MPEPRPSAGLSAGIIASFGISADQLARVRRLRELADVDPARLVADFYRWLETQPWKAKFFAAGVPDWVREAQVNYWREFLAGVVNDDYVTSRLGVGATHARIELPPKAYSTAMAFSQRWLMDAVRSTSLDREEMAATVAAISTLCQLDSALVMEAYADHSNRRLQAERDKLAGIHDEVTGVVVATSEGNFDVRYEAHGEADAELAGALNQMVEGFGTTIRQAKAIAAGDFSADITPLSERDALGRVLADMTVQLRRGTERTRRDQWLKEGQADLFEQMRGELELETLARNVLAYVARRLEAPVACLYVPEETDDGLRLAGTYGCPPDELQARVRPGEGVLGEAARERRAIYDLDVSPNPVRAFFGLGEIELTNVTILPLIADDQLRGVLQLAAHAPPDELQREFLTTGVENIAIGLNGALARERMRELLISSQNQSEALQAQAEELRATNEELETRSRDLVRARQELETKNDNLERQQRAVEMAQQELEERAADLAQASKYKSEFLANMSHELRTPLNSMLILSGSLSDNPDGNLSEKQIDAIRVIHSGGQDLLHLINDILDLSKVEAGHLSVHIEPVVLQDIATTLRQQFTPVADQRGLTFTVEISPNAPAHIRSDRQRIEQILKNLLSNAMKFTHEGTVSVRFAPTAAGDAAPPCGVRLSVVDTGIGVPEEKQRAIFEAFQQADGSTSRTYGGTGLGLAISRELAQLLGGRLTLESREQQGSTFALELPLATGDPTASPPPPVRASPMPSLSPAPAPVERNGSDAHAEDEAPVLLIIEDDPTFAQILLGFVRDRGYRGVISDHGREGLMLAERLKPHGIILDMSLRDIDGMEVLEQLKFNLATRHIPVHVVSGHERQQDALQHGAVAYLQKPVEQTQLTAMLERFEKLWRQEFGRVLVIEADASSRAAIEDMIGGANVTIDSVTTGQEGLNRTGDAPGGHQGYDCMIVDLGLPDMSGAEFLQALPADHPPVIVYTGQDLSTEQLHELGTYADKIVIKGASSPERLLDEVSLFLHQVDADLPISQREIIKKLHDPRTVLDGCKVLVVDDDMRNIFAMTELLQRQGLEVLKAKNGSIALEQLDAAPSVDLVIMDVMMPVMDGYEAMRRIRAQPRFASLPIIALTAKTLAEDRQACLEAGASDYLTKPMDPNNLLALIRVLLFGASTNRPAATAATQ
ncbi:MAG: response regulator [Planctomycetota bacterium]